MRKPVKYYGSVSVEERHGARVFNLEGVAPHVSLRIKHVFPRIATSTTGKFTFPVDDMHCVDLDWFLQRYPMRLTGEAKLAIKQGTADHERTESLVEGIFDVDWQVPAYIGLKEGQSIRRYQAQAIEFLMATGSLLLIDDVGLGKTYTAAGACLKPGALPAAVVVEPKLQTQWKEKIEEFTNLRVHIVKSRKAYKLPEADVYIFKYTSLSGWVDLFSKGFFNMAVYDETQELRTGVETAKGASARVLSNNVNFRLGLTGTPIYNYGIEMFNIVHYFIREGIFGTRDEFTREWCTNDNKKVRDPKALGTFLRDQNLMLRRTKQDVGAELDRVNRVSYEVDFDEKAVKSIEDRARQLAVAATSGRFVERGQAYRNLDILVRHATGVSKARPVAEFSRIFLENKIPVLLAGWHRDVYDIWLSELKDYNPLMYTGTETPAVKERNKKAFLNGDSDLLIMSLRAGSGVDGLQHRCSTLIVGELDWSPGIHHQLIGRLDREGQVDPVTAIFLYSNSGSDPLMMEINGLKASQAREIVDPHLGVQRVHSDIDALRKLAESYLDKKSMNPIAA